MAIGNRVAVVVAVVAAALSQAGCAITTAHRLSLDNNPLRQKAEMCEADCHAELDRWPPNRLAYARCLDSCPGATAIDGGSCADQPATSDAFCEETTRPNPSSIAAGTIAAVVVGAALFLAWGALTLLDDVFSSSRR